MPRSRQDSPTKICTADGCARPLRARGYCATHYNQIVMPPEKWHPKLQMPCTNCGKLLAKAVDNGRTHRFCDYQCRDRWLHGVRPADYLPVRKRRRARLKAKLAKAAMGTRGSRPWVVGSCRSCGTAFTARAAATRACSRACKRREVQKRRKHRVRGVESDGYSRHAIFRRDNWCCHICGQPTHRNERAPRPWAPTIDHVVPIVAGGSDTEDNVATAHFYCNSFKAERSLDEVQEALSAMSFAIP